MMKNDKFLHEKKIAVIGGGHAGCEAALAASRLGVPTFLWTLSLDQIANMPCNPSIGGTAKGHLVREIDALGGEMGKVADATFIQSRMLGMSKGAAVHSLRVQADRRKYAEEMKKRLENQNNLYICQGEIIGIKQTTNNEQRTTLVENSNEFSVFKKSLDCFETCVSRNDGIWQLRTKLGETFEYDAVILATGTFLGGKIIVGDCAYSGGPDGALAATELSQSMRDLGLEIKRFKTGTPPRVNKRSINFDVLEEQCGDEDITPFSFETEAKLVNRVNCYVTYTNEKTHEIIRNNLHRSPLYSGKIEGVGPRYCPSIEDKVVRFADKERHQLFLEPMGLSTNEYYIQGFSSSLPCDVQREMLHTIKGLENAEIMRYAYAIEYDAVNPQQLAYTLEYKDYKGLYGAGQVNGTSGYEEAAAQGLIAGINAALSIKGEEQIVLGRDEAYIGVMIDDLITKGVTEPYRMMTARAEFRLMLRQETADRRLTPLGYKIGLIGEDRYRKFHEKMERINKEIELLKSNNNADVGFEAKVAVQYEGYIDKHKAQLNQLRRMETTLIPDGIDYLGIKGLRIEARQKLDKVRPQTLGQAARVEGVNPADLAVLMVVLKKY